MIPVPVRPLLPLSPSPKHPSHHVDYFRYYHQHPQTHTRSLDLYGLADGDRSSPAAGRFMECGAGARCRTEPGEVYQPSAWGDGYGASKEYSSRFGHAGGVRDDLRKCHDGQREEGMGEVADEGEQGARNVEGIGLAGNQARPRRLEVSWRHVDALRASTRPQHLREPTRGSKEALFTGSPR
jgi:hypothetical protein